MALEQQETLNLFSYGTLQSETVQLATFGRRLGGKPDALVGYILSRIPILDQNIIAKIGGTHHRNVRFTGNASDIVEGTVLELTANEFAQADAYEDSADYKRVLTKLRSGLKAWVYLHVSDSS